MSPTYQPGFSGIHSLYLSSKVFAFRTLSLLLTIGGIILLISLISSYQRLNYLTQRMDEFAHIQCPEEAISIIVERDRAICILRRVAPGELTRAVPPGWLDVPRGRKKK